MMASLPLGWPEQRKLLGFAWPSATRWPKKLPAETLRLADIISGGCVSVSGHNESYTPHYAADLRGFVP
jgi:hypothetical protein